MNTCKKISFNNKILSLSLILLALELLTTTLFSQKTFKNEITQNPKVLTTDEQQVLGINYNRPQIYINGGNQQYSQGGMISLASTDEPAIVIDGYNISGSSKISVYEANENLLLDYLTHDKDGKQTKKSPDLSSLTLVTTIDQEINTGSGGTKVVLPLGESGIWYLVVKIGSTEVDAFVVRSNVGVIAEEGNNEFIFWGQDYQTKRSITEGTIKLLNLLDTPKVLQTTTFNSEGIANGVIDSNVDIALIERNEERAIVPINLRYLNTGYGNYGYFQPKTSLTRYFIFTDRPLYRPGDTVYFKAILREDDDARYTVRTENANVQVYDDYYGGTSKQPLFNKNYSISTDGTINGQYQIPVTGKTGFYSLAIKIPNQSGDSVSFDVEYFKKPDFSIDITAPQTDFIAGDKASFMINGEYFSGQPLINQKVKYSVTSSDFYEYQYLMDQQNFNTYLSEDYHYGYWNGNNKVVEGTATLDQNGQAEIELNTAINFNKGKTQVFSIEATLDDGSVTPSFARRNLLVYAGEYGIYRKEGPYGTMVNQPFSLPITILSHKNNLNVANVDLTAKIHLTNWVSYQEENKKYLSYKMVEEDLPSMTIKTDNQGNANLSFVPVKKGSYSITVEGRDSRGNTISKIFYNYVTDKNYPYYYSSSSDYELTIVADKQKYQPTDNARLEIYSNIPDRDVFLSLERGRVDRFFIVHLQGNNATFEVPLAKTDIPNMYAKILSFSDYALDTGTTNLSVSSDGKKLVVNISPDSLKYGPGETASVNVTTTDTAGNPISADLALWAVDKAIFELSDTTLGNVFNTFWSERYDSTQLAHSLEGIFVNMAERGGCFVEGTQVLMADNKTKNIEDVKVGDDVLTRTETNSQLVKAKVLKTHQAEEVGYLMINNNLKVTSNHILWVNKSWQTAGSIQKGDTLIDNQGNEIKVESIEWQAGKFQVYNLEIENYRTYFANGIWVHNQKGGSRSVFKDTAYWNATLHTDDSGRAKVSFKLPDNLTTWTLAAVGSTVDTRVGQSTKEIVVSKDLIVRPILPNILRTDDEITLSALVQNFTPNDQTLDVALTFDSGEVENALRPNITIKPNGMEQLYWKIKPTKDNEKAKLIFSAKAKDNPNLADIITQVIPVKPFGFVENKAETGDGDKTYQIKLAADTNKEKSTVTLSLSPTMIGSLPVAMKYLINYPYGCVEQTTSRFVPAVIAKLNQDIFAEALSGKNIDEILDKGVSRLVDLQLSDGGWGWWNASVSDPYITAYVVEYLIQAKDIGVQVDGGMLESATAYLAKSKYYDIKTQKDEDYPKKDLIAKNYALTLLGAKDKLTTINDLNDLTPDLLSMAVMTNYLNGNQDPESNGLNQLASMAKEQGDSVYWESGNKLNFGSQDASTAYAIRALVLANGDHGLAAKAANYLMRNRKSDYWSNTFATAQVVRAIVDFSKSGSELTPDYSYSVLLDDQQIAEGKVSNSKQIIKDLVIPVENLKSSGSHITLNKNGEGQIYSTLVINEFRTDKNAPAVSNGLSITREYINDKGEEYTLAVGDTVTVRLVISGLKVNDNYGIINDELPSGLVPINQTFKNEQYGDSGNDYNYNSNIEITENGASIWLYSFAAGEQVVNYKARVVSEGVFLVPPATVSLMYAPEIYGRSNIQTVKVTKESDMVAAKISQMLKGKQTNNTLIFTAFFLVICIVLVILKKRGFNKSTIKEFIQKLINRIKQKPPTPPLA